MWLGGHLFCIISIKGVPHSHALMWKQPSAVTVQNIIIVCVTAKIIIFVVVPAYYEFRDDQVQSVNGSSNTGHCSNVSSTVSRCDSPSTSVLFDGIIPTLTALDGNMWATQLLTFTSTGSGFLSFPFRLNAIRRVGVVMFNCPQWGISLQNVTIGTRSILRPQHHLLWLPSESLRDCTTRHYITRYALCTLPWIKLDTPSWADIP